MNYLPDQVTYASVSRIPADEYERLLEAVLSNTEYRVPYMSDDGAGRWAERAADISIHQTFRTQTYRQVDFRIVNNYIDKLFAIQLPLNLDYKLCTEKLIEFLPRKHIYVSTLIALMLTASMDKMDDLAAEVQDLFQLSELASKPEPTFEWDL